MVYPLGGDSKCPPAQVTKYFRRSTLIPRISNELEHRRDKNIFHEKEQTMLEWILDDIIIDYYSPPVRIR